MVSEMDKEQLEQVIASYEIEFSARHVPDLSKFLSGLDYSPELFEELLHTDLELRIRYGREARVEHYVDRFPQIARIDGLIDELIRTEIKVRREFEPGLRLEEFFTRFPGKKWIGERKLEWSKSSYRDSRHGRGPVASPSYSDSSKRFRKCKLHAQGGLGNIWLAVDKETGCKVALKEIKPKFINSPAHRSRFAKEALITSQLAHPGIVSVFGLGQRADGTPYFAMQFIQGRTLQSVIQEFHDKQATFDSLEFRRLIQHFLDVCNTVEYAHSQNIVHRDLKPNNVMIGKFGETFVVDWGLAQAPRDVQLGESSNATFRSEIASSFNELVADAKSCSSIDGTRIGSPGFMSPEQESGVRENIGSASDIYSLGATLYALVSNENPATANKDSVQSNQVRLTKEHRRLLSICKKAMAPIPANRYQSALTLAEDVENFLLHRRVLAHRESFSERFSRVARKYRGILNTAFVASLLLLGISLLSVFSVNRERQTAILARNAAEARTDQLAKTIDVFADMFSGTDAQGVGIELDSITLEQSLETLNTQIEKSDDPVVKTFLHTVLARNSISSGKPRKAIQQYETAIQLLDDHEINESDPLYLESLLGLCYSMMKGGEDETEIIEIADRIIQICESNPDENSRLLFSSLMLKAKLILRPNESRKTEEAVPIIAKLNEIGPVAFADEPDNIQLLQAKLLATEVAIYNEDFDKFFDHYDGLLQDWKTRNGLHALILEAEVQLIEHAYRKRRLQLALDRMTQIFEDAEILYGKEHPATLVIQFRYATMLAFNSESDPDDVSKAISIFEYCLKKQKELQNEFSETNTTLKLVQSLLKLGGRKNIKLAVAYGEELIDKTGPVSPSPYGDLIFKLNRSLCSAHMQLDNKYPALAAVDACIVYAMSRYGEESRIIAALHKTRQQINTKRFNTRANTAEAKKYMRIVAELMFTQPIPPAAELLQTYEEFELAMDGSPIEEQPSVSTMYHLAELMARAYEKENDDANTIVALTKCLRYSVLTYGEDSSKTLAVEKKIEILENKLTGNDRATPGRN